MTVQTTNPTQVTADQKVASSPVDGTINKGSAPAANPGKKPLTLGDKLELVQNNWTRLWNIAVRIAKKEPNLADGFNRDLALWNETAKKEDPLTRFENRRNIVIALSLSILKYQIAQAEDLKVKAEKFHAVPAKATELLERAKNDHVGSDWSRAFAATEAAQLLSSAVWTSGQLHWFRKKVEAMPQLLPDRQIVLDRINQARDKVVRDPIGANRAVDSLRSAVDNLESQRVAFEEQQNQGLAQIQAAVSRQSKNGDRSRRDRENGHRSHDHEEE